MRQANDILEGFHSAETDLFCNGSCRRSSRGLGRVGLALAPGGITAAEGKAPRLALPSIGRIIDNRTTQETRC